MTAVREWDVIVVGAGPAGSTAASLLARLGHSVLILDRAWFPRTKACGESINPGGVAELERLGLLDDVLRLPHKPVRSWRVHPRGGAAFQGRFPGGVRGLAIDRARFDTLLLRHAVAEGAQVREGARVVDLIFEAGRVVGIRRADGVDHRCRFLVGADGLRSVVTRRLGLLRRRPRLKKIGLTTHVSGAAAGEAEGELYLTPWGCAGLVRVDEKSTNVVLIVEGERVRRRGEAVGAWFDRLGRDVPALSDAHRTRAVQTSGPFDYPTRGMVAEGALLVGDAAGYFDPFTGQGIYRALRSARFAAEAIERCLTRPAEAHESLQAYTRRFRKSFRRGERLQIMIESALSRPPVFAAAAAGLRSAPPLADFLIRLTGDVPRRPLETPHL